MRLAGSSWCGQGKGKKYSLPVLSPSVALHELGIEVDKVAGEEEVVLRRHRHGVPHKGGRVDGQTTCHPAGYAVFIIYFSAINYIKRKQDISSSPRRESWVSFLFG